jgi:hypothetical protein
MKQELEVKEKRGERRRNEDEMRFWDRRGRKENKIKK